LNNLNNKSDSLRSNKVEELNTQNEKLILKNELISRYYDSEVNALSNAKKDLQDKFENQQRQLAVMVPASPGIFKGISIDALYSAGWKKVYESLDAKDADTLTQMCCAVHSKARENNQNLKIIIGVRSECNPEIIERCGFDYALNALKYTKSSNKAIANGQNRIYWYHIKGNCFGFASVAEIDVRSGLDNLEYGLRLSLTLNESWPKTKEDYRVVIFTHN